ncbi:hypothetical protein BD309DRAFT_226046 [Dichomitus squalens]|nr:hypothetical protein BD309DRAFT_226046 [Dichomitus squalens]
MPQTTWKAVAVSRLAGRLDLTKRSCRALATDGSGRIVTWRRWTTLQPVSARLSRERRAVSRAFACFPLLSAPKGTSDDNISSTAQCSHLILAYSGSGS